MSLPCDRCLQESRPVDQVEPEPFEGEPPFDGLRVHVERAADERSSPFRMELNVVEARQGVGDMNGECAPAEPPLPERVEGALLESNHVPFSLALDVRGDGRAEILPRQVELLDVRRVVPRLEREGYTRETRRADPAAGSVQIELDRVVGVPFGVLRDGELDLTRRDERPVVRQIAAGSAHPQVPRLQRPLPSAVEARVSPVLRGVEIPENRIPRRAFDVEDEIDR